MERRSMWQSEDEVAVEFTRLYDRDVEGTSATTLNTSTSLRLTDYLQRFPGFEETVARLWFEFKQAHRADVSVTETTHDVIPGYRLDEVVGEGGMGIVHRAFDRRLERSVAVKLISSRARLERFRREALSLARLDHPAICRIHGANVEHDPPYLVMEFVEGISLADVPIETTWPARRISSAIHDDATSSASAVTTTSRDDIDRLVTFHERCARALHHAHEHGIHHRDVKPGNIIVMPDGGPKLIDFGLAFDAEMRDGRLTMPEEAFGTLAFMAPEILERGLGHASASSDTYSLAASLFECLVGRPPLAGPTPQETMRRIRSEPARFDDTEHHRFPRDLITVVETALAKNPEHRYRTAATFADDLQRVVERRPILVRPVNRLTKLWRWSRRNPVVAGSVATAFLALSVGLIASRILLGRAEEEATRRHQAQQTSERLRSEERAARAQSLRQFAHRAAERGRWRESLTACDDAEAAGYDDAVDLLLARLDAWCGMMRYDRARAALVHPTSVTASPRQQARLDLLRGFLVDDRLHRPTAGLDFVRSARNSGHLFPAEQAFADALLATNLHDAETALRRALAADPTHHSSRTTLLIALVFLGSEEDLAAERRVFGALYPDDPRVHVVDAFLATRRRARSSTSESRAATDDDESVDEDKDENDDWPDPLVRVLPENELRVLSAVRRLYAATLHRPGWIERFLWPDSNDSAAAMRERRQLLKTATDLRILTENLTTSTSSHTGAVVSSMLLPAAVLHVRDILAVLRHEMPEAVMPLTLLAPELGRRLPIPLSPADAVVRHPNAVTFRTLHGFQLFADRQWQRAADELLFALDHFDHSGYARVSVLAGVHSLVAQFAPGRSQDDIAATSSRLETTLDEILLHRHPDRWFLEQLLTPIRRAKFERHQRYVEGLLALEPKDE